VLITAIFCAESAPDYQTGGESQESPDISALFQESVPESAPEGENGVLYGEIGMYLPSTDVSKCESKSVFQANPIHFVRTDTLQEDP